MEIEIIEVIWKQSKIYIPFNNKESIVYSKNGLFCTMLMDGDMENIPSA